MQPINFILHSSVEANSASTSEGLALDVADQSQMSEDAFEVVIEAATQQDSKVADLEPRLIVNNEPFVGDLWASAPDGETFFTHTDEVITEQDEDAVDLQDMTNELESVMIAPIQEAAYPASRVSQGHEGLQLLPDDASVSDTPLTPTGIQLNIVEKGRLESNGFGVNSVASQSALSLTRVEGMASIKDSPEIIGASAELRTQVYLDAPEETPSEMKSDGTRVGAKVAFSRVAEVPIGETIDSSAEMTLTTTQGDGGKISALTSEGEEISVATPPAKQAAQTADARVAHPQGLSPAAQSGTPQILRAEQQAGFSFLETTAESLVGSLGETGERPTDPMLPVEKTAAQVFSHAPNAASAVYPENYAPSEIQITEIKSAATADTSEITMSEFGLLSTSNPTQASVVSPVSVPVELPPTLSNRFAAQVAEVAKQLPDRPIEITLSPEELGRVKLTFQVSEAGAMNVVIAAERPETLELMRRNADTLLQDFKDLGYEGSSFEFQHEHPRDGQAPSEDDTTDLGAESLFEPTNQPVSMLPQDSMSPARLSLGAAAGVDIRL